MKYKQYYQLFTEIFDNKAASPVTVVAFSFLVLLFLYLSFNGPTLSQKNMASLFLALDDQTRMFEGEVIEGMTILDALNASVRAGEIKLRYAVNGKNETNIMELNGYLNHFPNERLAIYLNAQAVNFRDINKIIIKAGDKIKITFE